MNLQALQYFESETAYSLITRYYLLSGLPSYTSLLRNIYASRKIRIHPYLPAHLKAISRELNITPIDLLSNYTLYPLFSLFTVDKGQSLAQIMLADNLSSSPTIHLSHFRLPFYKGHKYCPLCSVYDSENHGCTHWRNQHQIPGITVCPLHHCKLVGMGNQDAEIDRGLILPPNDFSSIKLGTDKEILLAEYASNLLSLSNLAGHNSPIPLASIYREHLQRRGLVTSTGQLKYIQIVNELDKYWQGLPYGGSLEIPKKVRSFSFVGPLMRKKTNLTTHPIKHILFSCWLFDANAEFYFKIRSSKPNPEPEIKKQPDNRQIIALLLSRQSMGRISRVSGKSVCYIKRLAELNEISHLTNSNGYSEGLHHIVLIQAILGRHRVAIAECLGIGVGYVEQVISNTRGLSKYRQHLRQFKKVRSAINELELARKTHPDWKRKDFKLRHNRAFFYLYHHAKQRLEQILPQKTKPHLPSHDWSKEDERLHDAISELKATNEMSLSAIGRAINDRDHLRKKVHLLPKTKILLVDMGVIKSDAVSKK